MRLRTSTLLLLTALAASAQGADITWTGSPDADWNTAGNWDPANVPDATDERAVFNGTGANTVTFGAVVGGGAGFNGILVTSGQTAALSINSTLSTTNFRLAASSGITIESGAGTFSMGTSGSNIQLVPNTASLFTFRNDSSNTATLGNRITSTTGGGDSAFRMLFTGSGDWQVDAALNPTGGGGNPFLTKEGTGTLTLTANNTYTGGTTISAGQLTIGGTGRLGSGSYAGNIILDGTLEYSSSANQTLSGNLSGGGALLQTGGNQSFVLTGNNSGFTGSVEVVNDGYIRLGSSDAGSANASWNIGTGISSLVIHQNNLTVQLGALSGGGRILHSGGTSNGTVVVGNLGTDTTYSGVIGATLALVKTGTGTLTLTGANTYTGGTTINGGTLALGAASGTLGAATNTLTVGAGNSVALDLLGTANKTVNSGTITLNAGSQLTITRSEFVDATLGTTSFTGSLSGSGSLVIGGLPGAITVNSRRTRFASSAPLGTGGAFDAFTGSITVQSGANLALFNGTLVNDNDDRGRNALTVDEGGFVTLLGDSTTFVGTLNGGGTFTRNNGAGTTATLDVADGSFSGVISWDALGANGPVALTKSSDGTLTLSGANTYRGATQVTAGELILAGNGSISSLSAITIAEGATFRESSTATQTFGSISGEGNFIRDTTADGLKTFSGNNSNFKGTMTLSIGQNLFSNGNSGSAQAAFAVAGGADLIMETGTYTIHFGSLSGDGNFRTRSTVPPPTGTVTASIGALNTDTTFSGVISQVTSTLALTKVGTGKLTLTNTNSYRGATTINGGILEVTADGALGTTHSGTTVNSGATLKLTDVNYATAETLSLNGAGAAGEGALQNSGTSTYTGAITIATDATIHNGGVGDELTLTGGINKTGTTVTFSGAGTTHINGTGLFGVGGAPNSDVVIDGVGQGTTVNLNADSFFDGHVTATDTSNLFVNANLNTVDNVGGGAGTGGSGTVTIDGTSRLGGSGSITTASLTVAGQITGGDFGTVDTLAISAPTVVLAGTYLFDIDYSGMDGDLIRITDATSLDLTGSTFTINELNPGDMPAAGAHYYIKIFESNVANGGTAPEFELSDEGLARGQSIVTWDGGKTYYLVPEPASFALLGMGCLLLLRRPTRRRRRQTA